MRIHYFLRRRVYGGEYRRQWFAWIHFSTDGQNWDEAGDPYPVRTPTQEQIRQAIGERMKIPPDSIQLELKR
jgi:hypothetical protein